MTSSHKFSVPVMPRGLHAAWLIKLIGDDLLDDGVDLSTEAGETQFLEAVAVFLQCISGAVDNYQAFAGLRAIYNIHTKQAKAVFEEDATDVHVSLSTDPDDTHDGMLTRTVSKSEEENSNVDLPA